MKMFDPENQNRSERHRRLYALYEIGYTAADFSAAILFLIGSILFFYPSVETPAIWCFVFGSLLFALKPTLRFTRELHYLAIGDYDYLDHRAKNP